MFIYKARGGFHFLRFNRIIGENVPEIASDSAVANEIFDKDIPGQAPWMLSNQPDEMIVEIKDERLGVVFPGCIAD